MTTNENEGAYVPHDIVRLLAAAVVLLAGVQSACEAGPTSPGAPPALPLETSARAPSPTAVPASAEILPAPDAGSNACATFTEKALADLVSKIPHSDEFSPSWFEEGLCTPVKDGVWAIEYHDVVVKIIPPISAYTDHATSISAKWVLVRTYNDGRRLTTAEKEIVIVPYSADSARLGMAFDYDGDGEEEVLLTTSHGGIGNNEEKGTLWTARSGTPSPFPPARDINVNRLEDLDGDGRPDLITVGPYEPETIPICAGDDGDPDQVFFLAAHSRSDGQFSFADAPAAEYAKKSCPTRPAKLEVSPVDDASLAMIRCARLWGVGQTEALRAIHTSCRRQPLAADGCPPRRPLDCIRFDVLVAWAKATPPLQLQP